MSCSAYQEGYMPLHPGSVPPCFNTRCPYLLRFIVEPRADCRVRQWLFAFSVLLIMHLYCNNYNVKYTNSKLRLLMDRNETCTNLTSIPVYKYPLKNSSEVVMTFGRKRHGAAYSWFAAMRDLFVNIGKEEEPNYPPNTNVCVLFISDLKPMYVDKHELDIRTVEQKHPDVKLGGFYAPEHCRSNIRVAIIVVPYRNHRRYLGIFLFYMHQILKKQLIDYRIFLIEPFVPDTWNKGLLYNIAFLETKRFGIWDCVIFHEDFLIPLHEQILYGCSVQNPVQMVAAVEYTGYIYLKLFGGATAYTPDQFEYINGYSNLFWNSEGVEDDMRRRVIQAEYAITRHNYSYAIYTSLVLKKVEIRLKIKKSKQKDLEGLWQTKYSLVNVTKEKLYTQIVAHISPEDMIPDKKSTQTKRS